MREAKALARSCVHAGSSEPSPHADVIRTIISTVCIELRIGRFLEAERTTQDGGPFNTGKVGVSLYPI